jgi:hypothetical protein
MPTSIDENKAQMRQLETLLNTSGKEGQRGRSPNFTKSSATPNRASLGIHGAPYTNRHEKK